MSDELRARNEAIVRRFLAAGSASDERRALWAEDAVFELPLQGKVFRGREAILERGRHAKQLYKDWHLTDLVVHPMLDPNLFLVTHGSEEIVVATGTAEKNSYASILELRDGQIIRRVEYHRAMD